MHPPMLQNPEYSQEEEARLVRVKKGNPGNQEAAIFDGSMMRWGVREGVGGVCFTART